MSDSAIVIVADDKFLPHAQSLMVNCRREGRWDGDFVLVVPKNTDITCVKRQGIKIIQVPANGFFTKFYLFSEQLGRWRELLFLDCDCIVLSDLHPLFQQFRDYEPLEDGNRPIIADMEDCPAWMPFERACHVPGIDYSKDRDDLFQQLTQENPCVMRKGWNTAMLLYDPQSIPGGTVQRLQELQQQYQLINNPAEEGTDQQIIHIVLYPKIRRIKDKLWCFWGLDEQNARVASETRGWRGDEVPVVLHYCRWYAQWIEKQPGMDAYYNDRIEKVCHEFYADNLRDFDKEFPR